jgi:peroxiredoxin
MTQQALPEISATGATLVVISPPVMRAPRETEEPRPLPLEEMLRDHGHQVSAKFGLVFTLAEDLRAISGVAR